MSKSKATDTFNSDPEELEQLTDHEDELVALAAEVVLDHRRDQS